MLDLFEITRFNQILSAYFCMFGIQSILLCVGIFQYISTKIDFVKGFRHISAFFSISADAGIFKHI